MGRELIEAFDRADADDEVGAVIVTGAGRGYCAGADLAAAARPSTGASARPRVPVPRDNGGAVHAARVRLEEARDRGDQRPSRRRRRDDDAADGRSPRRRGRAHGLRVRTPRDRAGGLLELVSATRRRHQPGDGVGGHGACLLRTGGARGGAAAQPASGRRAARRRQRAGAGDRARTLRPCPSRSRGR